LFQGKHMNWKHLNSADCSTETDSQSMSVTQAGKVVKFLVLMLVLVVVLVVVVVMPVAADRQRLRKRVTQAALLIFNPKFGFFPNPKSRPNFNGSSHL